MTENHIPQHVFVKLGMLDKPTLFAVKGSAQGCAASWSQLGGNPSKTSYMY